MNRAAGKCRTFEEVLVEQSAPTLARIKPANLFRYQPADLRAESTERALQKLPALERLLGTKGISVRVLKRCVRTDALLILVYRELALEGILSDAGNRRFLKRRGYSPELGLSGFLEELSGRLCAEEGFPHEIGLLLGYPLEDVKGFIENRGQNCAGCYCWKSYSDPEAARRSTRLYRKCAEIYRRCFACGFPLGRLAVAA